MLFEFDQKKNESNIKNNDVSFEEARAIWEDPDLLVLPAKKKGEKRQLAIGKDYAVVFSAIPSKRGAAIWITSARRATAKEVELYEQSKNRR